MKRVVRSRWDDMPPEPWCLACGRCVLLGGCCGTPEVIYVAFEEFLTWLDQQPLESAGGRMHDLFTKSGRSWRAFSDLAGSRFHGICEDAAREYLAAGGSFVSKEYRR